MTNLKDAKAGAYLPASFLDWEGRVAAVIFISGCGFRCPWCHNGALVRRETEEIPMERILSEIKRRSNFLDGVVISGGEPTLFPGLSEVMKEVRAAGLDVKLDTNGSNPALLREIIDKGLAAHVAMDIKAPLDAESYSRLAGVSVDVAKICESIDIIKKYAPSYEFRTTYVPALHAISDLCEIREYLNDDTHWVVQPFKPFGCLDENFLSYKAADAEELKKALPGIKIRG